MCRSGGRAGAVQGRINPAAAEHEVVLVDGDDLTGGDGGDGRFKLDPGAAVGERFDVGGDGLVLGPDLGEFAEIITELIQSTTPYELQYA